MLVFFLSSTSDFLSLRARSTFRSPMLMLPLSGFSNLFRQRKNVDFPVPDGADDRYNITFVDVQVDAV